MCFRPSLRIVTVLLAAIVFWVPQKQTFAQSDRVVNFQGSLTTPTGTPVTDGVYTLRFRIYSDPVNNTFLWEETMPVAVANGLFTTALGESTALPETVFNSLERWLGIRVNLDPELSPRRRLTIVPYSDRVMTVDGATGGIIAGTLRVDGGDGHGGHFTSTESDTTGKALVGQYNGTNLYGKGVYGSALMGGAAGMGGLFEGGLFGCYGIIRPTTEGSYMAVVGQGAYQGTLPVPQNTTVYGSYSSAQNGYYNYGLQSTAWAQSGTCGNGTYTNYGVYAHATGAACFNYGVFAAANSGTNNIGIYAQGDYRAGDFQGNVYVGGTLSKSGGSFTIDHPLDPANKYLQHSFVESPDMMNIYNGNITTDARGFAEVQLPDYFEALNREFRYQLTVIGQFAQSIIAQEITDRRFVIQTDKPNVKVSWQVTGIRHDVWAENYRIEVEPMKPERSRGRYLNPVELGHPENLAENWEQRQQAEQNAQAASAKVAEVSAKK